VLGTVVLGAWGAGASIVAGTTAGAGVSAVCGDDIVVGAASGGGRSCMAPVPCERVNIQAP
jgi:glycerate-2-kinase